MTLFYKENRSPECVTPRLNNQEMARPKISTRVFLNLQFIQFLCVSQGEVISPQFCGRADKGRPT